MTLRANAKIAGVAFLAYIALGMLAMMLHGQAQAGDNVVAQLTTIAQHTSELKTAAVLDLLCGFAAITLGVTLFALTRDVDADLARMGLAGGGRNRSGRIRASVNGLGVAGASCRNRCLEFRSH